MTTKSKLLMSIVLLPILLSCSVKSHSPKLYQDPKEQLNITPLVFFQLENTDAYEVPTFAHCRGYLGQDGDDVLLYFSKTDYLYGNRENAVIVEADRKILESCFNQAYNWEEKGNTITLNDLQGYDISITGDAVRTTKINGAGSLGKIVNCWGVEIEEDGGSYENTKPIETSLTSRNIQIVSSKTQEAGESAKDPLDVSIYRMHWDPNRYKNKWLNLKGRLLAPKVMNYMFALELGWPFDAHHRSIFRILNVNNKVNQAKLEGTVIKGYSDLNRSEPILAKEYIGSMVNTVIYVEEGYEPGVYEYTISDRVEILDRRPVN